MLPTFSYGKIESTADTKQPSSRGTPESDVPFRIALLVDFSNRVALEASKSRPNLADRRPVLIDRDNFDEADANGRLLYLLDISGRTERAVVFFPVKDQELEGHVMNGSIVSFLRLLLFEVPLPLLSSLRRHAPGVGRPERIQIRRRYALLGELCLELGAEPVVGFDADVIARTFLNTDSARRVRDKSLLYRFSDLLLLEVVQAPPQIESGT